jgi:hypothetical protein
MTNAYKCDRCKEFYQGKPITIAELENSQSITKEHYVSNDRYDLCGDCGVIVAEVINGEVGLEFEEVN